MMGKGLFFAAFVGVTLLAVGLVQAYPFGEEDEDAMIRSGYEDTTSTTPPSVEETSTEGGSGWGWSMGSEGETASFGQTMIITDLAGSNTQSNNQQVEATASDGQTVSMNTTNYQQADLEVDINDYSPGGGSAEAGDVEASGDGPFGTINQGAILNNTLILTGVSSGGIISNPQTSAALSAGHIVLSTSGQATNGTNVNPGANNGWGWGSQGNAGWKQDKSDDPEETTTTESPGWGSGWGWPAAQEGMTASASSIESVGNLAQEATASDNITGLVIGDDENPVSATLIIDMPVALDTELNGNGVYASTGDNTAETEWQSLEITSYPENNSTISVENANATYISAQPSSSSSLSIGGVVISDWAQTSSGTNLVNNGGWGNPSQGWGQSQNQGWSPQQPQGQGWSKRS